MRHLRFLIAGVLAVPALAQAQAEDLTGTFQKIKETGIIALGIRDTAVPFSYIDDKQQVVGYTIDICMKVVDAIKAELKMPDLKVQTNVVTASNRIPLMANGTVDLECSNTTNNPDRQKQVTFSNSHFLTASKFVSRKADHIASIEGLKGKAVTSVSGSSNMVQLNQVNASRKLGITVLPAKDGVEAFLMVETGRAAAYVMDDVLLAAVIAGSKDPSLYEIVDDPFSKPEPYGIMLRRNDPAFKAVVDRATATLYKSPEMKAIYDKWFLSPIPPKGINFNVPIPPVLKHQFESPTDSPDPASYPG
ncbi:amino acid ABC transporter substrate-binding protein [Bosea sp. 685]|uniref:amino acid ABC transporter substrate-binding protein n=1 Tax=Bosea sp. 685 TaxID=3080057 RepID=UPI0039774380